MAYKISTEEIEGGTKTICPCKNGFVATVREVIGVPSPTNVRFYTCSKCNGKGFIPQEACIFQTCEDGEKKWYLKRGEKIGRINLDAICKMAFAEHEPEKTKETRLTELRHTIMKFIAGELLCVEYTVPQPYGIEWITFLRIFCEEAKIQFSQLYSSSKYMTYEVEKELFLQKGEHEIPFEIIETINNVICDRGYCLFLQPENGSKSPVLCLMGCVIDLE